MNNFFFHCIYFIYYYLTPLCARGPRGACVSNINHTEKTQSLFLRLGNPERRGRTFHAPNNAMKIIIKSYGKNKRRGMVTWRTCLHLVAVLGGRGRFFSLIYVDNVALCRPRNWLSDRSRRDVLWLKCERFPTYRLLKSVGGLCVYVDLSKWLIGLINLFRKTMS